MLTQEMNEAYNSLTPFEREVIELLSLNPFIGFLAKERLSPFMTSERVKTVFDLLTSGQHAALENDLVFKACKYFAEQKRAYVQRSEVLQQDLSDLHSLIASQKNRDR